MIRLPNYWQLGCDFPRWRHFRKAHRLVHIIATYRDIAILNDVSYYHIGYRWVSRHYLVVVYAQFESHQPYGSSSARSDHSCSGYVVTYLIQLPSKLLNYFHHTTRSVQIFIVCHALPPQIYQHAIHFELIPTASTINDTQSQTVPLMQALWNGCGALEEANTSLSVQC